MEPAENQVLPFPGGFDSGETGSALEVREDARVLAAIARGSQSALTALYQRRGSRIYSLLLRMLVTESEAEEAMQDTFIRIWRRAGDSDPERSSPLAWMIMLARGLALDRLRAGRRRHSGWSAYQQWQGNQQVRAVQFIDLERDGLLVQ